MFKFESPGLDVFPVCLGGNVFGWTADDAKSYAVLDAFFEGGGNFIDTADSYSHWAESNEGGESETLIGQWMKRRRNREKIVLATKVGDLPGHLGQSQANILRAVDASLSRLQTEVIDLYYAHRDDPTTPLEETLSTYATLIQAGKIRNYAVSNYDGPRLDALITVARENGFPLPAAVQPHYNLMERSQYETELAPIIAREAIAVVPYYSLASGFLTGKYRRGQTAQPGARTADVAKYLDDRGYRILEAVEAIAGRHGVAASSVALAWLRARPMVIAPIASASDTRQVPALLASAELVLADDEIIELDAVSR